MPIENPYYTAAVHGDFQLADIGDVALADGATLRGCQLAYQTLGTLNAAKDNAVLIPTWYSGNHSVMRDTYVGAGRAIDPADHFVVLVNQIGSGLGTSPHNLEGAYGRARFPRVRIGDDVVAQERLLREVLGVEELALVFGGSMGAQQTYEWAVRFPDRVKRAAPLAGTARSYQHCVLWTQTLVDTLRGDPGYAQGWVRRLHRRPGRAAAARRAVRPLRAVQRVLEGGALAGARLQLPAGLRRRLPGALFPADGRGRPAGPGVEVAAR